MTKTPDILVIEDDPIMREALTDWLQAAGYGNAALDKALAATGGWAPIGTRLRWPYRPVPAPAVDALRQAARDELPEFFPAAP